ncbi:formylmethanofuran dehydrogenase subunit C [Xanthobacter sp. 126]|jgi:formylmethanofuran dehydrogenase subunit C|uniref:formylmethanofuran dehydrogenase subunit C n=1 Tax=Xanthobacter sp. 126 TaxID=1131814 RepID=UPI00045E8AEE|nr:formylmethanofuran dehydrogenase subunit C [Xanthobacter sp. 126]
MPALTFTLKAPPPERLDLSPLVPERLNGLDAARIERITIGTSRLALTVADLFTLAGDDPSELRFEGGSERFDQVGANLASGHIHIDGDVGQRCGLDMTGGTIEVRGSAGPFAGAGATEGRIVIHGDAGEKAGGAVHGGRYGLAGATLVIHGNAGPRAGDRMRRGMLLVGGSAGDHAGSRMIAGTILARRVGAEPGLGMRRGTIAVGAHGTLTPTFMPSGSGDLIFMRLLRSAVAKHHADLAAMLSNDPFRFVGDQAALGKGEILVCG